MEIYIISNEDLSIKSVCEPCSYSLNLDEETNGVSEFVLPELNSAKKGYYLYASGLSKPFVFLIDDVLGGKNEQTVQVTALDISNIFDRKIIETGTDVMTSDGIEDFIADCILNNFVNSNDSYINIGYIEIYIHSHTKRVEPTNAEDGLFNLHTFITNCRQNKNIFCNFTIDTKNQKLKIDIENKTLNTVLIDTTLEEVTDYNKIYDVDVCSKVTVLIREDNSTYDLYLLSDRTTTTNKNDPNRVNGRVEVISVDTADKAPEEALNVMKGNTYKHLVEFSIAKTSQLVDVSNLDIGTPIKIKTEDDIYDSYISAIAINDTDNFVSFKSGSLRVTLIDKIKQEKNSVGNKLDVSGGKIVGNLNVEGISKALGVQIPVCFFVGELIEDTEVIHNVITDLPYTVLYDPLGKNTQSGFEIPYTGLYKLTASTRLSDTSGIQHDSATMFYKNNERIYTSESWCFQSNRIRIINETFAVLTVGDKISISAMVVEGVGNNQTVRNGQWSIELIKKS